MRVASPEEPCVRQFNSGSRHRVSLLANSRKACARADPAKGVNQCASSASLLGEALRFVYAVIQGLSARRVRGAGFSF